MKYIFLLLPLLFTSLSYATRGVDADYIKSTDHSKIWTLPSASGALSGYTETGTFTNKSISGSSNTFTNIPLTTAVTGALPIANGGTGQTGKTGAFDALSPNTTKGDVTVHNGTNNTRLSVGADGTVLTADSTQASGIKWGSSLTNPMTASGDLIYGGASGVATRLPKGSDGQYLRLASGIPAWQTPTLPTVQIFTSGSGTYTPSAGCKWTFVRMVGAGGGGSGGGTSPGNGGAGGNTTFGTLTANGGAAGTSSGGGAGGTAASSDCLAGGSGAGRAANGTSFFGGGGGSSYFGGAGTGGNNVPSAGTAGATNTGSGGGGGGNGAAGNSGSGGGSGSYCEKIITSPSAVSYSIGASGTSGTAGTSGAAGGAGGSGIIIVQEFY